VIKDASERVVCPSTDFVAPESDPTSSPEMNVAQRLIVLSLAGLADELTWARY
jgi:hypothetical protein